MTTPYEIALDCYHAGSMGQPGKTIHPGTVEKWTKEIEAYANQVSEERVRDVLGNIQYTQLGDLMGTEVVLRSSIENLLASLNKPQEKE